MLNALLVVNGEKIIKDKIFSWLNKDQYKLILAGLFTSSSEAKNIECDRACWLTLFNLQDEFVKYGYSVAIVTEKGSIFNLVNAVQSFSVDVVFLPKTTFLSLAVDEFDDFLSQLQCPLILY
jgi:hypothetical protein